VRDVKVSFIFEEDWRAKAYIHLLTFPPRSLLIYQSFKDNLYGLCGVAAKKK
jgi:hypothetical protein